MPPPPHPPPLPPVWVGLIASLPLTYSEGRNGLAVMSPDGISRELTLELQRVHLQRRVRVRVGQVEAAGRLVLSLQFMADTHFSRIEYIYHYVIPCFTTSTHTDNLQNLRHFFLCRMNFLFFDDFSILPSLHFSSTIPDSVLCGTGSQSGTYIPVSYLGRRKTFTKKTYRWPAANFQVYIVLTCLFLPSESRWGLGATQPPPKQRQYNSSWDSIQAPLWTAFLSGLSYQQIASVVLISASASEVWSNGTLVAL